MMQQLPALRDPQKHISHKHFMGRVYMGDPCPNFCLCAFLGGPKGIHQVLGFRV